MKHIKNIFLVFIISVIIISNVFFFCIVGLSEKSVVETQKQKPIVNLVDEILDKANRIGIENLSKDEKNLLKKASKILKKDLS